MKLPRDVTGVRLANALQEFVNRFVRQRGSHIHLVTDRHGEHHVVVPDHRPMRVGTLGHLLNQVAEHHGITRDELMDSLRL